MNTEPEGAARSSRPAQFAQSGALFGREMALFPPRGIDEGDNFFAAPASLKDKTGRLYVGVGAPGRARNGSGQAGVDSSSVRAITPGNAVPGLYSVSFGTTSPFRSLSP